MKRIEISIKGIRPIIMHNGRLADPLDPFSKALKQISGKRTKTDEDHEDMANIEQEAGLYWSDELGVYLPVDNIQRMFLDACKKLKQGRQSIGIFVDAEHGYGVPLKFNGHKSLKRLLSEPEFRFRKCVAVNGSRVIRTRPLIPTGWTTTIPVELDLALMDVGRFKDVCDIAGDRIGVGDWRPGAPKVPGNFGRFVVEEFKELK